MAKKEDTSLVVQQEGGAAVTVPEYLKAYMGAGVTHITKDDLQIPRISIAQGLSPQINPEKPEYIEGLRLGDAFNSATNTIYKRGPWDIAVVRADPPRWVEFIPRDEGGGVKDPNVPAGDPRTMYSKGPNGEDIKPKATKFYDYIIVFLDTKESVALSLKSTGIRVAKKLNTLIIKRGPVPLFMGKYKLAAVMAKGGKGDYGTFTVANNGYITDEETLKWLAGQFDNFKDKPIVIDREPGADEDEDDNPDM